MDLFVALWTSFPWDIAFQRGTAENYLKPPPALTHLLQETALEGRWENVVRVFKGHALRLGNWRWQRFQERAAGVINLPAQEHGIVFVNSVVAMLHEHAAEIAELHGQSDAAARTQSINILAALLPCRYVGSTAVPRQNLAFFKMDVDRVVPATASVLESPDFARPELGRSRDASIVGVERAPLIVSLNAPGAKECRHRIVGCLVSAASELENPFPCDGDIREIGIRNQRCRHLAHVRRCRIANDAELQEFADTRVRGCAGKRFSNR